jgi:hypothetical protein
MRQFGLTLTLDYMDFFSLVYLKLQIRDALIYIVRLKLEQIKSSSLLHYFCIKNKIFYTRESVRCDEAFTRRTLNIL